MKSNRVLFSAAHQLQSPLGTALARPAGAASIVTLGAAATTIPDAKLALTASPLTMGFDSLGQPFTVSASATTTTATAPITIPLTYKTGGYPTTLSLQPFTGEITIQ